MDQALAVVSPGHVGFLLYNLFGQAFQSLLIKANHAQSFIIVNISSIYFPPGQDQLVSLSHFSDSVGQLSVQMLYTYHRYHADDR